MTSQGGAINRLAFTMQAARGSVAAGLTASTLENGTGRMVGLAYDFLTQPLSADFTLSGTISCNIWGMESNMNNNAAPGVNVQVLRSDGTVVDIGTSAYATELGTASSLHSFTITPTSTALNKGDRLRVRVFFREATATSMAGGTASLRYASPTASVDGDTWVEFTENLTFQTLTTPAGTKLYPRNTTADVPATANVDQDLSIAAGASEVVYGETDASAPIHIGTIDWFTKPLNSFTLQDYAKLIVRCYDSVVAPQASVRGQLAVVNGDGTGAVVWAQALASPNDDTASQSGSAIVPQNQGSMVVWLAGDDLAVTTGQRLRLRLHFDHYSADMTASATVLSLSVNGAEGAAGGTFLQLSQSVTEVGSVPAVKARRWPGRTMQAAVMRAANR